MFGPDPARDGAARGELGGRSVAAGGEEAGLGDEKEKGPEDEGGDVDRLQGVVDQEIATSVLP